MVSQPQCYLLFKGGEHMATAAQPMTKRQIIATIAEKH
jgi:hypothetical protein